MSPETTPIWDELANRWAKIHGQDTPDPPKDTTSQDVPAGPLNPDCDAGKHTACSGTAWDEDADELTACACRCHAQASSVAVAVDVEQAA